MERYFQIDKFSNFQIREFSNSLIFVSLKKCTLEFNNHKKFEQVFTDFYVNLCRFAYTYVKNEEMAEEVVQELFISLWEQRDRMEIKTSVRSFLYTSVRNRALNYIRDNKTRALHEDDFAERHVEQVDHIINFCEREELQSLITDAIGELPEQCRTVFELSRNDGLSYKEIAEKLSVSPKTVENQMGIALKKLRGKLGPYLSCILTML
jgi:RNA polymerase sigma-70 factor (ECF subfamily)